MNDQRRMISRAKAWVTMALLLPMGLFSGCQTVTTIMQDGREIACIQICLGGPGEGFVATSCFQDNIAGYDVTVYVSAGGERWYHRGGNVWAKDKPEPDQLPDLRHTPAGDASSAMAHPAEANWLEMDPADMIDGAPVRIPLPVTVRNVQWDGTASITSLAALGQTGASLEPSESMFAEILLRHGRFAAPTAAQISTMQRAGVSCDEVEDRGSRHYRFAGHPVNVARCLASIGAAGVRDLTFTATDADTELPVRVRTAVLSDGRIGASLDGRLVGSVPPLTPPE